MIQTIAAFAAQIWVVAAAIWIGLRLARLFAFRRDEWPEYAVASGVLAIATAQGLVLGLGSAGMLSPFGLSLSTTGCLGAALWFTRSSPTGPPRPHVPRAMTAPTAIAIGLALPFAIRSLAVVPLTWDALTYHLVRTATWIEAGALVLPRWPAPFDVIGFYPSGGSAWFAFLMGVLRNDLLAAAPNLALIGLAALAVAAVTRRLGGSPEASAAAGLLYGTLPIILNFAASPWVEPLLNLGVLAAVLFALRIASGSDDRRPGPVLLVGLSLGLACGTKFTALPIAAWILGCLAVYRLRADGPLGAASSTAWLLLGALSLGGYWYLRNGFETGNPVYPVSLGPLAGAPVPSSFWGESLASGLGAYWRAGAIQAAWVAPRGELWTVGWKTFLLVPLAAIGIAAVLSGRVRGAGTGAARASVLLLGATAATLGTYAAAPNFGEAHVVATNLRFAAPGLALGGAMGMAALARWGVPPGALAGVVAFGQYCDWGNLDTRLPGASAEASLALSVAVAGLAWLAVSGRVHLPPRFASAAGLSLACVVALAWSFAAREESRYEQYRDRWELTLPGQQYFADAARFLEERHAGRPLAIAAEPKLDFLYLFAGRRLDRRLVYVDAGSPRSRATPDARHRAAWARALAATEADLLLTMRRPRDDRTEPEKAERAAKHTPWPVESRWARALGLPELYRDTWTAVFAVPHGGPGRDAQGAREE